MSKFSIVTLSFNQGQFLERAIRSVLDQDYQGGIEYIVVDPGSTDGSRGIIERYRSRLSRVILEPDKGAADGLNKGFACATGDIFGFINADDAYLPGAFRAAAEAMEKSRCDVVYANGYFVDQNGQCIRRCLSTPFNLRRYALGGVTIMQQSTFFRAGAYRTTGGFNVDNRTSWDGELLYEFGRMGLKIRHVPAYWSIFRRHSESLTTSGRALQQYLQDVSRYTSHTRQQYGPALPWVALAAKVEKYIYNPGIVLLRAGERLFGPPAIGNGF